MNLLEIWGTDIKPIIDELIELLILMYKKNMKVKI